MTFHRWVAISAGLMLLALGSLAQAAGTDAPPAVQAQQVADQAFFVQGLSALGSPQNQNFISNAGFVITQTSVVVIDALGSPALADRLVREIRRHTALPISHVFVTHYHADHIYGLQRLKAEGARVVAHRAGQSHMNSSEAEQRLAASRATLAPWVDGQTRLVAADEWLDGEASYLIGGVRFEVKAVGPAHTAEDIVVYLPQSRVLYAGDLVFSNRIPYVGQADSRAWIQALESLLPLDARAIVPGHGPASTHAQQDMRQTLDYLRFMRQAMATAAGNLDPFDQAYQATDWSRFEQIPLFHVANRMNAYNTYLLLEQEAGR